MSRALALAAVMIATARLASADVPHVDVDDLPPLPADASDDAGTSLAVASAAAVEEDVVVGAAKREQSLGNVASAVTVVSGDRLRRMGYRTVAEALRGVAGVYVVDDHYTERVGVRGLQVVGDFNTRLLLLVDGATVNEPWNQFAGYGWDAPVAIDDIARIEVIRGPVSSVYGTNAFFGIVNIVTRGATEGTQLVLAGEAAEGVPLLEAAAARVPERYEPHALLGHHYADRERWRDAALALEAYQRTRPATLAGEDDRHALDLAEAYLRTRRAPAALALYEGVARRHPTWMTARLGQAWALAAVDCGKARPLLRRLAADPKAPATVALVDGQCALATGAAADALTLARRYLAAEPRSAAGLALVGEAEAARGDLTAARAALTEARSLEPDRARYAVRLARVLRAAGDHAAAVAELEPIAVAPDSADYRGYWLELGEALIAVGRGPAMLDRLQAALATAPDDAELGTMVGGAQLAAGDHAAAAATLERALASVPAGGGALTRTRLSAALLAIGEAALARGDAAAAEPALVRADAVASGPPVWRALGAVRLARGDAAGAVEVLGRAAPATADAVTLILAGRAQAARGELAAARAALAQAAQRAEGARALDVGLERAAIELAADAPAAAVAALLAVPAAARATGKPRWAAALVTARHAAGLAALRDGQAGAALELLDDAAGDADGDVAVAIRCDAALAAVATGDRDRAAARLKAIAKLRCPFPAPADTQAVPILTAFVDGLNPRRAGKAVDRLAALAKSATGVSKALAGSALRVVAMAAADQAYRAGKLDQARKHLATARAVEVRAGADELAYDLAALDLADGKLDAARAGFAKVAARVPEALIGAGIVADRDGDSAKALDLWRQAKKAGARLGVLDDWIAAKERIFGGGGR